MSDCNSVPLHWFGLQKLNRWESNGLFSSQAAFLAPFQTSLLWVGRKPHHRAFRILCLASSLTLLYRWCVGPYIGHSAWGEFLSGFFFSILLLQIPECHKQSFNIIKWGKKPHQNYEMKEEKRCLEKYLRGWFSVQMSLVLHNKQKIRDRVIMHADQSTTNMKSHTDPEFMPCSLMFFLKLMSIPTIFLIDFFFKRQLKQQSSAWNLRQKL